MKLKLYGEKGITLVALVVTIIVLIILAGVSINLILGNNGIITKAKIGKERTEQARLNEEEQLNSTVDYMETLGGNPEKGEYAPYDTPYIPSGFEHIEGTTWNNGFTIKGVTQNVNDEFVWVPCVTDQSKVREGDSVVTFGKTTTGKYNDNSLGLLPTDVSGKINAEDKSVSEMQTSVSNYGGFYIAKYEAGIEGEKDNNSLEIKTSTTGNVKPLSQAGKGPWNYISRTNAITVSKAMLDVEKTGVKSTLVSGEAWDTTLQWIVSTSTNKETNKDYDINSSNKGWYSDKSSNKIHTTGYHSINNIYDMAGNIAEWTAENCLYNNRKLHGSPRGKL